MSQAVAARSRAQPGRGARQPGSGTVCLDGRYRVCLQDAGGELRLVISVDERLNPVLARAVRDLLARRGAHWLLGAVHDFLDFLLQWLSRAT